MLIKSNASFYWSAINYENDSNCYCFEGVPLRNAQQPAQVFQLQFHSIAQCFRGKF